MLDCKLPLPRSPAVPAWSDPKLVMATGAFRAQTVTVPASTLTRAAPDDPKRIAIGFKVARLPSRVVSVGPIGEAQRFGTSINSGSALLWYDLFTYGAMVCLGWELWPDESGEFGADVRVYEIYRQL